MQPFHKVVSKNNPRRDGRTAAAERKSIGGGVHRVNDTCKFEHRLVSGHWTLAQWLSKVIREYDLQPTQSPFAPPREYSI